MLAYLSAQEHREGAQSEAGAGGQTEVRRGEVDEFVGQDEDWRDEDPHEGWTL